MISQKLPESNKVEIGLPYTHLINKEWCKGCGICVHFCPKKILDLDKDGKVDAVRPGKCIGCRLCELRCPDRAIEIIENRDKGNGQQG